ncbi:hypothetical protein Q9R32_08795 [Actinotalea sp. AC32]|nr:hypothetical protein [Actinotalea sp. AC32]
MRSPTRLSRRHLALPLVATLAALGACAGPAAPGDAPVTTSDEHDDERTDHDAAHAGEVAAARPRIVTTYDGGLLVVDASTLDVLEDVPLEGFLRLGPVGDGRHVFVTTSTGGTPGFRVLDVGSWTDAHGDHGHHYAGPPHLTDVVVPAAEPGHAIPHGGVTTLFDDATGAFVMVEPETLLEGGEPLEEHTSPAAHHGFALRLDDGRTVATVGDDEVRTGIRVLGADGAEVLRSEECPGVHGEAVVGDDVVLAGCEDGVLVLAEDTLTKLTSPTPFGRIGNLYVTDGSPVAAGDMKTDPDQGLTLTQVALVDTTAAATGGAALRVVDLPAGVGYTWRGIGRADDGSVLVLGTDGSLHVLDEATGEVVASHAVIDEWTAPEEWQEAHPALIVLDGSAYVTHPASRSLHAVDPVTGEVWRSAELPAAPNELIGTEG